MKDIDKLTLSIDKLQPNSKYKVKAGDIVSEETFNSIEWHTENTLTWSAVNAEMTRLQTEYDAQEYARKRKAEYPTIEELVVALYDTDDKSAIEAKRAEVKAKYPK
jgi:hypothetical protein